ncbi:MAG: dihydrolipoyl dehydrogenase family protein [Candidatus Cryptobacteroides sp.]
MKLIVIGAGPGGYETAVEARRRGFDVTLVTAGKLGGTCLNQGCIPTKCFCHDARTGACLEEMVARKDEVVARLSAGVEQMLKGVEVIYGIARVVDAHTVSIWQTEAEAVQNPRGAGNEPVMSIGADRIIVATGSHPAWLGVPGADTVPGVLSSSDMLNLKELPHRLTVIGGGVIGLEFASIFNSLGTEVTVIEYCRSILPNLDSDIARRLKQSLSKRGVRFILGTAVTALESGSGGQKVLFSSASGDGSVSSDKVLMACGRVPDTRVVYGCEGIEWTRKGIVADENMETTLKGVYAVGDVNGRMMLAHAAVFQGRIALNHICSSCGYPVKSGIRQEIMPSAVFTDPPLASVGLSEEACKEKGIAFKVCKSLYGASGMALASESGEGVCKILAAQPGQPLYRDGQILGCHIIGASAPELVSEVAALMNFDATVDELSDIIHPHPSFSEILLNAVR